MIREWVECHSRIILVIVALITLDKLLFPVYNFELRLIAFILLIWVGFSIWDLLKEMFLEKKSSEKFCKKIGEREK